MISLKHAMQLYLIILATVFGNLHNHKPNNEYISLVKMNSEINLPRWNAWKGRLKK